MVDEPDPNSSDPVVDFHLPSLLAQARALAELSPEMRVVGLVADKGTSEADMLASKGTKLTTGPDESVSALLSRELAKDILYNANPKLLEWLYHDWLGSDRRLPIIHSADHGTRTGSIPYDLPV
jgi:hypothetical protein